MEDLNTLYIVAFSVAAVDFVLLWYYHKLINRHGR